MRCDYQCHEIGGPWIAENPDCPIHGTEAQARDRAEYARQAEEAAAMEALLKVIADLTTRVESLEERLRKVEFNTGRLVNHSRLPPEAMPR